MWWLKDLGAGVRGVQMAAGKLLRWAGSCADIAQAHKYFADTSRGLLKPKEAAIRG